MESPLPETEHLLPFEDDDQMPTQQPARTLTPQEQHQKTLRRFNGYSFRFLGMVLVSLGISASQVLNDTVPYSEILGVQYTAQFLVVLPFLLWRLCSTDRQKDTQKDTICSTIKDNYLSMTLVAVLIIAIFYASHGAAYYLSLGVATITVDSIALVLNLIARSLIRRKIRVLETAAVALCVIGVVLFGVSHYADVNYNRVLDDISAIPLCHDANATESRLSLSSSTKQLKDHIFGSCLTIIAGVSTAILTNILYYRIPDVDIFTLTVCLSVIVAPSAFVVMAISRKAFIIPSRQLCFIAFAAQFVPISPHGIFNNRSQQLISPVSCLLIANLKVPLLLLIEYMGWPGLYLVYTASAVGIVGSVFVLLANSLLPLKELFRSYAICEH